MDPSLIVGLSVLLLAGVGGGAVALPQKFIRTFAWENTWGTFWLLWLVVIPAAVIPCYIEDIWAVWSEAGATTVMIPIVFGLLWGVGCVTFGMAIHMLGLSLGMSLIMGTLIAIGSSIPLVWLHPEKLTTLSGWVILLGIALSVLGVALVGVAGMLKERALREKAQTGEASNAGDGRIKLGIVIALFSGVASSGLNLGFAFSEEIPKIAVSHGAPTWAATLASWQLIFWSGFVVCGSLSVFLMIKNRTWGNFVKPGAARDAGLALIMAVLNISSLLLYGLGAHYIGAMGTSLGFTVFMTVTIILANILGFMTGEWKGVGVKPVRCINAATLVLIISICVLGIGNSL